MNIKFTVLKSYNHFFFVQTLADWHFSCRPEYTEQWLTELGPLTGKERESLSAFKNILKKTGFDPIKNCSAANTFDFFMRFDEFKNESTFFEDEIKIYQDAMKSLEPKFNILWESESKKFEKIKNLLNEKFNLSNVGVSCDLKTLFTDQIDLEKEIEVILLLSTEESGCGGGGANNGPNIISLECSSANLEDINYLLSTLWHEITHLILEGYIKKTALIMNKDDIIKEASLLAKKNDFQYSEELLSFSLFSPMSFLVNKHFPTDISKKLDDSILQKDEAWLLEAKHIFLMYLIHLNGQFIEEKLDIKQPVSSSDMASALIDNHKIVQDYFLKNNKKVEWFNYC